MNALMNTDALLKWTKLTTVGQLTKFLTRMNIRYATCENGQIVTTMSSIQQGFETSKQEQVMETIRIDEVIKMVKMCRASIYQLEKKGMFPKKVALGKRAIGWRKAEVLQWMDGKRAWGEAA